MSDQDAVAGGARPAPPHVQALLALQSRAGNVAVSRLVAGQADTKDDTGAGGADRPVAPQAPVPEEHPGFVEVTERILGARKAATRHEPAAASAKAAQAAARPPAQDKLGQAKEAKAAEMEAAKPNAFDKDAFIAAVNKALAAQAPKNLSQAMNYKESGKADAVKTQIMGQVGTSKEQSAKPLAESKNKPPDLSVAVDKPVIPLAGPAPVGPKHALGAQEAMPPPAPPEQLDLSRGPLEVAEQMRQAEITEQQLADSNEPEFTGALNAKHEAEEHSATAPGGVREREQETLSAAGPQAQQAGSAGSAAMTGARGRAVHQVASHQSKAKAQDEAKRAEVTTHVNGIFDTTKSDVDKILTNLDAKVDQDFADGEKATKEAFTTDLEARMDAYKDDRYSGLRGKGRWIRDKFKGLPESAMQVYVAARATYESRMQSLIARIADTVGTELTRAKARVAAGRAEIATYVDALPKNLKAVGGAAAEKIGGQLDELESSVDDKGQELAEDLATKYTESRKAVDEEITAMQEANKGFIAKVKDLVVGVIKIVLELKDLLLNVLSRVAGAIGGIIAHPIRFLGTLVEGVSAGVSNFRENIGTHLKEGLKTWLFGHLEGAGVELPDELDAKGVVTMVLSIAGLTKDAILERIRAKVPEPVLAAVAKSVEFVQIVMDEGIGGLYRLVVDKIGDVAESLKAKAESFIITRIIKAGITWVLSLLSPASAFIKACKAIINIVGFFFGNLDRIKEFVNSVLDSIENFIAGDASSAAKRIEDALGRTVPIIIGFLANLLDLGDIGETVRSLVAAVQKPVKKVVDGFITIALRTARPLIAAYNRGARGVEKIKAKATVVKESLVAGAANFWKRLGPALGRQPVDIGGESHTLYVESRSGSPVVMMSSEDPDSLVAKVDLALAREDVRRDHHSASQLRTARKQTKDLQAEIFHWENEEPSQSKWRQAKGNLKAHLTDLVRLLGSIAVKFQIEGIDVTRYVVDGQIRSDLRQKMRSLFYRGDYGRHMGAKMLRANQDKRANEVELKAKFPEMYARPTFYCPGVPAKNVSPHLAEPGTARLDHMLAVVDHWNDGGGQWNVAGRETDQATRSAYYVDANNLRILCETCNGLKDAGKEMRTEVGPGFTGPDGVR